MSTNTYHGTAEIIPFPSRARPSTGEPRDGDNNTVMSFPSPRVARVAFGSGWYHEAAIQEAELTRRN
ncbi:MAG TPA: DUF2735 domain-containing protein [Pseudolabrys sp.]|nr:DUF2735 domain-containing protein [Pseudolabrys sp.]